MSDTRKRVRSLLKKLTAEREQIDRAIEALRPLAERPKTAEHREQMNGTNGAHHEPQTTSTTNGANGTALPAVTGPLADVIGVLRSSAEPMRASAIHRALGRKAPTNDTAIFHILSRGVETGVVARTGTKGNYRFALQAVQ